MGRKGVGHMLARNCHTGFLFSTGPLIHILGLTLWGNFKTELPFTRSCGSPRNAEVRVKSNKKGVQLHKPEAPAHLETVIF